MAKATPKTRLSDRDGRLRIARGGGAIRARYDAAVTTDDNRRHWANADGLSANAAGVLGVRQQLRSRARYEVANNSYARGIVNTLANDCVGTGPRLQMQTQSKEANALIERLFRDWAREIRLAEKLRTMRAGRAESGEAFGVFVTNLALVSPVKLDLALYEADQFTDPSTLGAFDPCWVDGIHLDPLGNPLSYRVMTRHPGSLGVGWLGQPLFDDIPARQVIHFFRPDRPGQRRGLPDLTPALPLFAQLRRYTLAVVAAAETAADYAAVIYSNAPADGDEADSPEPMDTINLEKRMATVLPAGWQLGQMKAEQPTTTYGDFVWTLLREICRCINVPLTIAALDSSRSNLSAAYLDHQTYAKSTLIDRADLEEIACDRVLDAFLNELHLIGDHAAALQGLGDFPHAWFWPSLGQHADPAKVANAQGEELGNGTTNYAREYAKKGLDWEAEQLTAAKSLGVSLDEYRALLRNKLFGPQSAPVGPGASPATPTSGDDLDPTETNDDDEGDAAVE